MQCVGFNKFGQLVAETGEICSFVLLKSDDFLASASLDAVSIAQSFGWGFGTIVGLWYLSYGIRAAQKSINKI